ncbi:chorismate mutase [Cohaesibacter sp. ES.047]|uniref:chorismate mutase n=1 Tax=Cohaesibacter sp. ES.047 TaxID=1798205 RepID=UPI000BB80910|nr:chorismate mutase [Cohaesibacter sp. ES.047]SNY90797.1 chorismate mutase [Cohaesibacter sp. ES.047]
MTESSKERDTSDAPTLDELRQRIDRIDEVIHHSLIERSEIVKALISVKRTDKPGAAFRPGREVDMMRRLVGRHRGILPITTVEHLWREIIATFTHMQAPFDVVVAPGAALRDVARFYFGFTVGFKEAPSAEEVIKQVRAGEGSVLGVVGLAEIAKTPWWLSLSKREVQVIARLPVIRQEGRPVDTDAVVLSMPLMDTSVPDMNLVAIKAADRARADDAIRAVGGTILSVCDEEDGIEILATMPFSVTDFQIEGLTDRAETSDDPLGANSIVVRGNVGGYWSPISLT